MNQRRGLIYALIAATIAGFVSSHKYLWLPLGNSDVDQLWVAARAILHGQDAYAAVGPGDARWLPFPLFYPLTAGIVLTPLAPFPLWLARLVWVTCGAALFGYAIGRDRAYLWPTFLGMPFFTAVRSAQWSPLLTAAMLLPALGGLAVAKPNVGIAMLAGARSWRAAQLLVIGGTLLLIVSLVVDPHWPWRWREALQHSIHFRPLILRPGGFLMLLAFLRRRDPDARLLVALAIVPMTGLFYDILPACLVARTRLQAAALALPTILPFALAFAVEPFLGPMHNFAEETWINGTLVLWCGLIPPLVLVLLRSERVLAWRQSRTLAASARGLK